MADRIIDTGLKGNIQKDILASVLGQLSDGYWENSDRMEMYWRNIKVGEQNGNVVLIVKEDSFPYYAMGDQEVLQWFGKKIKFLIKKEFENNKKAWKRTNTKDKTVWLSHSYPSETSVSDCYQAYDILMGRNTTNKKYALEDVFNKTYKKIISEGYYGRRRGYYSGGYNRNYTGDWDDEGPVRHPGDRWSRTQWDQQMEWLRQDCERAAERARIERPEKEAKAKEIMKEIEANPSLLDDDEYCDNFWRTWWLSDFLTKQFRDKFEYKIDAMRDRRRQKREENRKKRIY